MAQPLVGKHLVPWHGGSASTWVTSMVFFQAALLGGYVLAYLLQRVSLAKQAVFVAGLALIVPFVTQMPPLQVGAAMGAGGVLLSLVLSLLPAILLTTCLGILMHGWFRAFGAEVPYYLYSISNIGSLLALCSYPFLIEPRVGLAWQGRGFFFLLILLSFLTLVLAFLTWKRAKTLGADSGVSEVAEHPEEEVIGSGRKLYWFLLSAAACVAMIGSMRILSAEIGSNPISWILPLAIYLLSFSVAFSGLWRRSLTPVLTAVFALVLFLWIYEKGLTLSGVDLKLMGLLATLLFVATHLAHGLVYLSRPKEKFEIFYVVIALGGVCGGFFTSISAPSVFSQAYEFVGAMILILGAGAWAVFERDEGPSISAWVRKVSLVLAVAVPGVVVLQDQVRKQVSDSVRLRHVRSIYGQFSIETRPGMMRAISETTLHGVQWLDEARHDFPTSYYHPGGALGRVLVRQQENKDRVDIGIVGLGVGTLAAYGRTGDRLVFWDIDPNTFLIAGEIFSFVPRSLAEVEFRLRDGRIGVREAGETYDLLVIDAFSGDSIPPHLMTREAIVSFLEAVPKGVLAIHVSNRFMDLFPILATHARALGVEGVQVLALPNKQVQDYESATPSKYFFFLHEGSPFDRESLLDLFAENFENFQYSIRSSSDLIDTDQIDWTDDRHSILDIFGKSDAAGSIKPVSAELTEKPENAAEVE